MVHVHQTCVLHPVGSVSHVVHSVASGAQQVDSLFFMLRWDWYRFQKESIETRYAKLEFLHSVGYVGHVMHSGASGT
jgi:hypothetical protein